MYHLDQSPHLNGKPHRCHWCGNDLSRIRHVYRGQGSQRFYDSKDCHLKGEDNALREMVKVAGTVHSPWYLVAAILIMVLSVVHGITKKARAQAHHPSHAEHHDVYKGWLQSNGFSSCCNGDDPKTGTKGDCRPARAYQDPDDDLWRVLIRGKWEIVPPNAVRPYSTPDGNSHVCETVENGIMCFVGGKPKA